MYAAKAKGKNRVQVFELSLLQDDGKADVRGRAGRGRRGRSAGRALPADRVGVRGDAAWRSRRWCAGSTRLGGCCGPAEFIPVAERTGAIVGIGEFVLRQACADSAGWSRTVPGGSPCTSTCPPRS